MHALRETLNLFIQKYPQIFTRVSGKHFTCHSFLPFASAVSHPRLLLPVITQCMLTLSKILRLLTLLPLTGIGPSMVDSDIWLNKYFLKAFLLVTTVCQALPGPFAFIISKPQSKSTIHILEIKT